MTRYPGEVFIVIERRKGKSGLIMLGVFHSRERANDCKESQELHHRRAKMEDLYCEVYPTINYDEVISYD